MKDLDASIEFYNTDIPYNMRYIRLHSRPLYNYLPYIANEYSKNFPETDEISAIEFAELFEKKLGANYYDLKQYFLNVHSKETEDLQNFIAEKYKTCQAELYYQLRDVKNQEFFKVLLKQQLKSDTANENSWIDLDTINTQVDFGMNDVSKLVKDGVISLNDQQLRFTNKKMYNCVLSKFSDNLQ